MSSSRPIGARFALVIVPLLFFGCFTAGDDNDGEGGDDDTPTGCRIDADCRAGRVCIDVDGDRDGLCESDEDCSCGPAGTGGTGNTNGGSGGNATGGSSEGGGGNGTGGSATGGATTGGNGTGGATGGSSTGGSSGDCGAYCDRIDAAMCAATDRPACLSNCASFSAACSVEAAPLLACIANPANQVACMSGSPTIQGCDAEIEAMDRCFACVPESGDMECATCAKMSCCDELGEYSVAPDVQGFFTCLDACTTNECVDGCITMYPVAGAAAVALVDCQNTDCAEPCLCEVSTDDDTCTTCYKGSCCSEYVAYVQSPDLDGFETCAIECMDDPCIEECGTSFPVAGNNYGPWAACAEANCSTQCQ